MTPATYGLTHIALKVKDLDRSKKFQLQQAGDINKIVERIKEAGGDILSEGEFVPGSPFVFFKDPDGYEVEVWYEADIDG